MAAGWLGDAEKGIKGDLPYIFSPGRRHLNGSPSHTTNAVHLSGLGGIRVVVVHWFFLAVLNPI